MDDISTQQPTRIGRRSVMAAAVGAAAAAALARAVGAPEVARAGTGAILLGAANYTADPTGIFSPSSQSFNQYAALNHSDAAVRGFDGRATGIGVEGFVDGGDGATAVRGSATPTGIGVYGKSENGTGVLAEATGGYGLLVRGRAVFNRSGLTTIAAGHRAVTISRTGAQNYVGAATLIVATIQDNVGNTWVSGVTKGGDQKSFTIHLNRAAPRDLVVGFFLVN